MVLADGTRPRKHAIVETAHIGTTPPNRTRTVPFKNEKTFGMEENENADPSPLPPSGLPRQLPRAAGERPALRHAAAPANGALARAAVGPSARHEARPPAPAPRAAGDERPAAAALRREAVGVRGRAPALRQATAQHRAPCEAHARGGAGRASHEQRRRSALARGAVGRVHGTGPAPRRRLTAGATVPPPPFVRLASLSMSFRQCVWRSFLQCGRNTLGLPRRLRHDAHARKLRGACCEIRRFVCFENTFRSTQPQQRRVCS